TGDARRTARRAMVGAVRVGKDRSVSESERGKAATIVLVVDDDPDICVALEMLLRYEGFEVWTAANARQALTRLDKEQASGRRAEVVLTDVKMPDIDGLALLERLRERPDPPAVLMISGHGDVATAVDAVRRGALDFLEKPLDQNRVIVALQNALRQTRLAK